MYDKEERITMVVEKEGLSIKTRRGLTESFTLLFFFASKKKKNMVVIVPAVLLTLGLAATTYACPHGHHENHFKKHTIKAKGIEASFIEYGATLTV